MGKHFFDKINYSASNEDSESERKALNINADDVVLCITGSGARSLDLLVDLPKKIISIDLNKSQNLLLELKIAAYKVLDYDTFLVFLGLKSTQNKLDIYQKILPVLSDEAKSYWNQHQKLIVNGVLYCGTWERFLKAMKKMAFTRKSLVAKLMNAQTLTEQQNIWQNEWDNWVWRSYLKLISNRFLWVKIIREPGAKIIEPDFDVYQYMKQRMNFLAMNFLMKENHYANLIFNGNYSENCILPHHLRPENFDLIKQNIHKIAIVTDDLGNYLQTQENQISAFSLSDFSSYAPKDAYENIWQRIIWAAKPNAKFCERLFLVKRKPESLFSEIRRNIALENELNKTDEAAIYTFCAGKINKAT
jgi:S-adenosylmethionine-diacylglycerol 3-amino-3-carboxypropyl transferase